MSTAGPESLGQNRLSTEDWRERYQPAGQMMTQAGPGLGLLLGGLALIGLGALAWAYLGPDIRRYIKMSQM
jgi:hypothetical protein